MRKIMCVPKNKIMDIDNGLFKISSRFGKRNSPHKCIPQHKLSPSVPQSPAGLWKACEDLSISFTEMQSVFMRVHECVSLCVCVCVSICKGTEQR